MELYTSVSYELADKLTKRYSTSFSMSSQLFPPTIRRHIYAIYGMVRIADEIVDTYRGTDILKQLGTLEKDVAKALKIGYSTNPIVHAFAQTARKFDINDQLIAPFFESMRIDITTKEFDQELYTKYIYGSAEVIGLMCLKVFTSLPEDYARLEAGARALGAAYQKVNFLRDMQADYKELGRVYFPGVEYEAFDEADKNRIIREIKKDFRNAQKSLLLLPASAQKAVSASYLYYSELLVKLEKAPAKTIKEKRIRVNNLRKIGLLLKARYS